MHPGVTVENSKGQKDELIVQGKGTFRYYVNAHRVGLFLGFRIGQECVRSKYAGEIQFYP